jgi:group I intron endonuclease
MIVYKITNKINGKSYIGQTVQDFECRLSQHFSKSDTVIQKAIRKYGKENFEYTIIDNAESIEQLNSKECFWIKFYRTLTVQNGYNVKTGGSNARLTLEEKKIVSKKTKEAMNKPEVKAKLGRVWTKEEKEAKAKQMKGRKLSKEHKEAISKALKGKKKSKEHIENSKKARTGLKYKTKNTTLDSEGVNNE